MSLVLVAGAAVYFVPQYLNPQAGPPPPPLGSDAAPAVAAAPSPVPTPTTARLADAEQQMAAGRWSAASSIYADIARATPTQASAAAQASAQAGWARALIYDNKPADAVEHAQKAVDLEPRSAEYQAVLALAFDWSGNPDRALAAARRATELDNNLPEGWAYLAEAHADKFHLKEAADALGHANAAGSDNSDVLRVQAYLAEVNADYATAVDMYKRAIQKAPERSYLYISLGHALRAAKQLDAAIQAYQQAADLNPEDARAEGGMGATYYAMEEYDSAQAHLDRAVEVDPNYATGWGQLGWVFYVQKLYDKAQPNFEKAIALEKDPARNAEYRHALGWIYLNAKQYSLAKEQFTRALEQNPDLEGAKEGLKVLATSTPH